MSDAHIAALQIPDTAATLQLNCRRSPSVLNSLFNDVNIANFLILAIQEPAVNHHTNRPPDQSGWHLIVTQPPDTSKSSRPRSCIYLNSTLNVNIQPITSASRDIAACVIQVDDLHMLLVNVYNQPRTFNGFEAMDTTLRTLPTSIICLPTIIVADPNLHSTLWNPDAYTVHDASADALVEAMAKWNLYLRSPKGIVTFETSSQTSTGTTIDLVWVNPQVDDMLIACLVDEDDV